MLSLNYTDDGGAGGSYSYTIEEIDSSYHVTRRATVSETSAQITGERARELSRLIDAFPATESFDDWDSYLSDGDSLAVSGTIGEREISCRAVLGLPHRKEISIWFEDVKAAVRNGTQSTEQGEDTNPPPLRS